MARTTDTLTTAAILLVVLQQVTAFADPSYVKQLDVPPHAERYSNQTLTCNYDLGTRKLYQIKWFLNDDEFFRYMPEENPPMEYFSNPNLDVIMDESTGDTVRLREVDLSAAGEYKCEVSSDRPDFLHSDKTAKMIVVVIPNDRPSIEGDVPPHYHVNDHVNLNCTAAPSIPAATLVWIINDSPARPEYLREYDHLKTEKGLYISTLGLSFKLSESDFIQGELKLTCTATIATLYHKVDEHSQVSPTGTPVRDMAVEGNLVTANGPNSGSQMTLSSLLQCLMFLHTPLLLSVQLLR